MLIPIIPSTPQGKRGRRAKRAAFAARARTVRAWRRKLVVPREGAIGRVERVSFVTSPMLETA